MNISDVSKLLQSARRGTASAPSLALEEITTAATRCYKAYEFACISRYDEHWPEPREALEVAKELANTVIGDEWKCDGEVAPKFQHAIETFNEISEKLAAHVCVGNQWLTEGLDEPTNSGGLHKSLVEVPEVKLWWYGKFKKRRLIDWEEFWEALNDYMGSVYGYPVDKDDNLQEEIQNGIISCIGKVTWDATTSDWDTNQGIKVSMGDFKALYQRFGPWKTLYHKTLTLCTGEGFPEIIFYPSENARLCDKYLKKTKGSFVVRLSGSKCGNLVHHSLAESILILNTPSGYSVQTKTGLTAEHADVRLVLDKHFSWPDDGHFWRNNIDKLMVKAAHIYTHLNETPEERETRERGNTYEMLHNMHNNMDEQFMKLQRHGSEKAKKLSLDIDGVRQSQEEIKENQKEHNEHLKMINEKLVKIDQKIGGVEDLIKDCHKDVIQFGLQSLKKDETVVPRLFYIIPADYDELEKQRDNKEVCIEDWHLYILCEGDRKWEYTDKELYECHPTEKPEDRHELKIPSQQLVKYLPCMRYGLKFTKFSIDVLSCEDLPGGSFVELVDRALGVKDKLTGCHDYLEDLTEKYQKTKELKEREVQNSYKLLRDLLTDDQKRKDDLLEGKCGSLNLMWNKNEHRPVWVCEEHRKKGSKFLTVLESDQQKGYALQDSPVIEENRVGSLSVAIVCAKDLPNVELAPTRKDTSDPYVKVRPYYVKDRCLGEKKTKRKNNSINPEWQETLHWMPKVYLIDRVRLEVWDHNRWRKNTFIGGCDVNIRENCSTGDFKFNDTMKLVGQDGKEVGEISVVVDYHIVNK